MKIGLLTYHHSVNNGAMLQTYATVKALKQLGHDVFIVDIRQSEPKRTGLTGMIVKLVYGKHDREVKKFKERHYPPLTRHYYSLAELRNNPPLVDCLIVGSDQVWNPDIAKETLLAYFLDFGNKDIKRISYASSFGVSKWDYDSSITASVKRALDQFSYLSVREETGVRILNEVFNLESKTVVDPTMLFDNYHQLTGKVREMNEVVCYKINRTKEFFDNIGKVKSQTHLPVRLLNNSYPVKGLRYTYPPSVEEWIRRIAGAKYVITDSFHGVVFSILYQRNFVVIKNNNGKDSRMLDLLASIGLEQRVYESVGSLAVDSKWLLPIDYTRVNPKVEELRRQSWEFLKNALNS